MKKVLLLMFCALMGFALNAQVSDNFSDYTVDGKLAQQAQAMGRDYWTTWSQAPGGGEDGVIDEISGNKCLKLTYNNDQILKLNNKTTGVWELTFKFNVPAGKDGYFNVKSVFPSTVSETWAVQVYLATDEGTPGPSTPGMGIVYGGSETGVNFNFTHDTWVPVKIFMDLDSDYAEFYINDNLVHTWIYSTGSFGLSNHRFIDAFNIYPPNNATTSTFYIDDVVFASVSGEPIILHETSFDDQPNGSYVAQSYPDWWATWDNNPGTSEDALITNEQFETTPNSAKCAYGTDLVFKAGNQTTGAYMIDFDMYVPNSGSAYFNLLHIFSGSGSEWAIGVYFNTNGSNGMPVGTKVVQNNIEYSFTFPYATWFPVSMYVNLDEDVASIKINDVEILEWQFSLKESGGVGTRQLAAVDFYPPQAGSVYYIDNFVYAMEPGETFPIMEVIPEEITETADGSVITVPVVVLNSGTSMGDYASWIAFDFDPPSGSNNFTLTHCNVNAPSDGGLGYPGDLLVELGAKFSGSDLCDKIGTSITKMSYFLPADVDGNKLTFRVYGSYSDNQPGEILMEFEKIGGLITNYWNEITFPTPVLINQGTIWLSVEFFQYEGMFPIGVDNGPLKTGVNFTRRNGGAWSEFTQTEFGNFAITAEATGDVIPACWISLAGEETSGSVPAGGSKTFDVVLDPTVLEQGVYYATLMVATSDEDNLLFEIPVTFAVGISINSEMDKILVDDEPATLKPGTTTYTITVKDVEQVFIEAIPVSPSATVTGDMGTQDVTEGLNTFNFKVTAQDGVHFTDYVLEVTMEISPAISEIDNTIKLFPNPVKDYLNITSDYTIETITIYDLTGKVVKQVKQPGTSVNLSDLAVGYYMLKVTTEQGDAMHKFVKE
ncbi:MAG: T9SS type A sorting domain-containing protein [Bacteroidales bacterium]|nr:T9SS type A sorting domain-containing protein [Bacteroidales bacterium]